MQDLESNNIIRYLIDDRYRVLRHGSFILGLLLLFYSSNFTHDFVGVYKFYFLFSVWSIFMAMFYINMYVLVPSFFFRSQYLLYLVLLVALVALSLTFTSYISNNYFTPHRINRGTFEFTRIRGLYDGIIISVPIILVTTTMKLFQRWMKDRERISDLKNLALTMELSELKNQINPHFLFNMLNNVKALIRKNPEKATEVIIKLSEVLRYQLYENDGEKTSLASEVNFISNFLNLEEIRRDNFSVKLCYDTLQHNNIFLPPNLFTTFVENAVKHSADIDDNETFVEIRFDIREKELHFTCINSKSPEPATTDKKYSGLGLNNIKRRLNLLYGDKYLLKADPENTRYTINLTIPLA